MKEQQKNFKILLSVLIVLLVLFFVVSGINSKKEKEEAKDKEAAKVYLYQADGLKKMSYKDSEGQTMRFIKEDNIWKYEDDPVIEMDQDVLQIMESSFSNIQAVKEIKNPDEPEDYGLSEPTYTLIVEDEDGKTDQILIGDPSGDNYYMKKAGSDSVYTVAPELVGHMVWELSMVTTKEQFVSVTENNFVKELVATPDGKETLYERDNETLENEINTITSGYAGMYFSECVDYHVTEDTIRDYGLAEDQRTKVVLTYQDPQDDNEEKELTYYVGSLDDSGTYYYVQLDGSLRVNKVTQDEIDQVLCKVIYEE